MKQRTVKTSAQLAAMVLDVAARANRGQQVVVVLRSKGGCGPVMTALRVAAALDVPQGWTAVELAWLFQGSGLKPAGDGPTGAPLRAPHHTCSTAGLMGGGGAQLRPGEISLAHGGVLLLDETGEFLPSVLAEVASALSGGEVAHGWGGGRSARERVTFPARPRVVVLTEDTERNGRDRAWWPERLEALVTDEYTLEASPEALAEACYALDELR